MQIMALELETITTEVAPQVWARTIELALAPLNNQNMLWIAIPLLIATLFMTLYFGRYKREELGWNTAFGNTMVFLFVALNLIKEMYQQGGSLEILFENRLYLLLTVGLMAAGVLLMFVTYFHLLPKRLAFFLFSAPPINVAVYVAMAIVYADVPTDYMTVLAGVLFLILILVIAKILQLFLKLMGLEYRVKLVSAGPVEGITEGEGFKQRGTGNANKESRRNRGNR